MLENSRRKFIRQLSLGSVAAVSMPAIVSNAYAGGKKARKISIQKNDVILFQGDSITDAGRKKDDKEANSSVALGRGYAVAATAQLLLQHAGDNLSIYNRGISGNKVYQLAERWDADCLDIKPRVVSILVGVNDYWHTLVNGYKGTVDTYRNDYDALLKRTREKLPNVELIIGEPFAVNNVKAVTDAWFPAFNDYRQVAADLAKAYDAVFIPYQTVFNKALEKAPGSYWTADGVHPSLAGAQLMSQAWLEAVK
ncbi:Lysophospholipase L1 [Filimonas lacunae]|uniref:Lysophospholipase L1 n=1 Tax=Filimonas lacunae TaxID=477680 RepID=A0A173MCI7_9BACT|nr:SGNH/GDSL hydrolase family protein [Filimonas lacunae]BAV05171.1 lipase/acylhydrolase family protein [Filimonas lacunae]SIT22817.1 Lysophospholipase L1 [Filimonas lacunae]